MVTPHTVLEVQKVARACSCHQRWRPVEDCCDNAHVRITFCVKKGFFTGSMHLYRESAGHKGSDGEWCISLDSLLDDFAWVRADDADDKRRCDNRIRTINLDYRNLDAMALKVGEIVLGFASPLNHGTTSNFPIVTWPEESTRRIQ